MKAGMEKKTFLRIIAFNMFLNDSFISNLKDSTVGKNNLQTLKHLSLIYSFSQLSNRNGDGKLISHNSYYYVYI